MNASPPSYVLNISNYNCAPVASILIVITSRRSPHAGTWTLSGQSILPASSGGLWYDDNTRTDLFANNTDLACLGDFDLYRPERNGGSGLMTAFGNYDYYTWQFAGSEDTLGEAGFFNLLVRLGIPASRRSLPRAFRS